MTTKVTKESLVENIGRLESYGDLSLNEEYQLKAYRLLIDLMPDDKHEHNWLDVSTVSGSFVQCTGCGKHMQTHGEDDQHAHMVD